MSVVSILKDKQMTCYVIKFKNSAVFSSILVVYKTERGRNSRIKARKNFLRTNTTGQYKITSLIIPCTRKSCYFLHWCGVCPTIRECHALPVYRLLILRSHWPKNNHRQKSCNLFFRRRFESKKNKKRKFNLTLNALCFSLSVLTYAVESNGIKCITLRLVWMPIRCTARLRICLNN
jgi:hypothetical protein